MNDQTFLLCDTDAVLLQSVPEVAKAFLEHVVEYSLVSTDDVVVHPSTVVIPEPPVVTIKTPLPGAVIANNVVNVTAFVSTLTQIIHAELFVDANPIPVNQLTEFLPQTFVLSWRTKKIPKGPHVLRVRVVDIQQQVGLSASVTIQRK